MASHFDGDSSRFGAGVCCAITKRDISTNLVSFVVRTRVLPNSNLHTSGFRSSWKTDAKIRLTRPTTGICQEGNLGVSSSIDKHGSSPRNAKTRAGEVEDDIRIDDKPWVPWGRHRIPFPHGSTPRHFNGWCVRRIFHFAFHRTVHFLAARARTVSGIFTEMRRYVGSTTAKHAKNLSS